VENVGPFRECGEWDDAESGRRSAIAVTQVVKSTSRTESSDEICKSGARNVPDFDVHDCIHVMTLEKPSEVRRVLGEV
jgi:hypothetical protein